MPLKEHLFVFKSLDGLGSELHRKGGGGVGVTERRATRMRECEQRFAKFFHFP